MSGLKVVFAPGCFDGFEGTQEELQELVAEIRQMAENGTIMDNAVPLDLTADELDELLKKNLRL